MASFQLNQAGMRALANGPEIRAVVTEVAGKGKAYAETTAPRDTGQYASSFDVAVQTAKVGRYERTVAVLTNTAPYAAALEWGNRATRGRAPRVLGKTLAALRKL